MVTDKAKIKTSEFPDSFFKLGEVVEGEVIEHKRKAVFLDIGKTTGIIFGREYIEAQRELKKAKPGDKIKAKIIEIDGEGGYVELSLKSASKEIQEDLLRELQAKGEALKVKVVDFNRGGLVLKFKDFSGFLPTSQMKKEHFPKADTDKEILSQLQKFVGQTLEVKIFSYSPKQKRLVFSERI